MMLVRVPERGTTEIGGDVWKTVAAARQFWELTERGILIVEQVRAGRIRLRGGCYVGRAAITRDLAIEVHEKVPGSIAAMLQFAYGSDFRIAPLPAPRSELGGLVSLLIASFLAAVRSYASRGRLFEYGRQAMTAPLIGGRLDVTRTVRLRARGLRHLAAFHRNVIRFQTPVNTSVLEALREVDRIRRAVPIPAPIISGARALSVLFSDCRTVGVLYGRRADAAQRATALAAATRDRQISDMLSLAAIILAHESFEWERARPESAPRSWFLNLETLFEKAIRELLGRALSDRYFVAAGRTIAPPIFSPGTKVFRANPDIVVRDAGNTWVLVGDVKYKQFADVPAASDAYQLLVHAAAFDVNHAFLVFPGDATEHRSLGQAVTGTHVDVFTVDLARLDASVGTIASHLDAHHGTPAPVSGVRGAP